MIEVSPYLRKSPFVIDKLIAELNHCDVDTPNITPFYASSNVQQYTQTALSQSGGPC